MFTINIIGYGYVGSSLGHLLTQNKIPFNVHDLEHKPKTTFYKNLSELVIYNDTQNTINIYFICVPTPSDEFGQCDTSIVQKIVTKLNTEIKTSSYIIIKSTLVPGTTEELVKNITNTYLKLFISPEFLREKTCFQDIYNAPFTLVGIPKRFKGDHIVEQLFRFIYKHQINPKIIIKTATICEILKYTINVFLAVKVWYFNEIYEIVEHLGENYSELFDLFYLEPRLGNSHMNVPGHDGKFGFGLSCLPKETRGINQLQKKLKIPNLVFPGILQRNQQFRQKKNPIE